MGVLLGLTRPLARSERGTRVHDFKPFYRGAKVTVIGAISIKQVLAVMTLNGSMNSNAFKVFVEKCKILNCGRVPLLLWIIFQPIKLQKLNR
ncbi:MAG: hypothetical protein ACFB2X_14670 [Rivularia sp. (in: cyanobacteria)]